MNLPHEPVYGLLLSGGRSERMGQDKATLIYHNEPQLLRAMNLLNQVCERAFVSARTDQISDQQDTLRQQWPIIADTQHDIGPLAGIAAAQTTHPDASWLVIACDLPLLDASTVKQLLSAREVTDQAIQAIAFESEDSLPEPLCTLWRPGSARAVRDTIARQHYSPRKLLQQMQVLLLRPHNPAALRNVNSLDEYLAITTS